MATLTERENRKNGVLLEKSLALPVMPIDLSNGNVYSHIRFQPPFNPKATELALYYSHQTTWLDPGKRKEFEGVPYSKLYKEKSTPTQEIECKDIKRVLIEFYKRGGRNIIMAGAGETVDELYEIVQEMDEDEEDRQFLDGVCIYHIHIEGKIGPFKKGPKSNIKDISLYSGANTREPINLQLKGIKTGACARIMNLADIPELVDSLAGPIAVFCRIAPEEKGKDCEWYSFGNAAVINAGVVAANKTDGIIVGFLSEEDKNPYTFGATGIHRTDLTHIVTGVKRGWHSHTDGVLTDTDIQVGNNVEPLIADGATLQVGIGGSPNASIDAVARSGKGHFRIFSEMISNSAALLYESGLCTAEIPFFSCPVNVVAAFAGGDRVVEIMNRNPRFVFLPEQDVTDDYLLRQFKHMTSLLGFAEADLRGQINAVSAEGFDIIGGQGGGHNFAYSVARAPEGKVIYVAHSTRTKRWRDEKDEIHEKEFSRIVPSFKRGSLVINSCNRYWIATENKALDVKAYTLDRLEEEMTELARNDFRRGLWRALRRRRVV